MKLASKIEGIGLITIFALMAVITYGSADVKWFGISCFFIGALLMTLIFRWSEE